MTRETQWLLREKYRGKKTKAFFKDMERVKQGEPIDYVIGFTPFLGCTIDVSLRPFIPRPETEYWVEKAIEEIRSGTEVSQYPRTSARTPRSSAMRERSKRILDLFAGSGAIGVAVAKHMPNAYVDFGEKEDVFLTQIAMNIKRNRIPQGRARVIKTDVFEGITKRYDFIFANPPYIATTRKRFVQDSVLAYEPHEALFAGEDGLLYIRKLIQEGKEHLVPGGAMYIEFDSWQKKRIETLAREAGWQSIEFWRDQYGKWRVAVLRAF